MKVDPFLSTKKSGLHFWKFTQLDGWKSILSEFPEKRTTLRGDIDFLFRLTSSLFRISLENSLLFLPVSEISEFSFLFRMESIQ